MRPRAVRPAEAAIVKVRPEIMGEASVRKRCPLRIDFEKMELASLTWSRERKRDCAVRKSPSIAEGYS
jgi:hypothetical protein